MHSFYITLSHYQFWNSTYGMALKPGAVGENLTIDGLDDGNVSVGDIYRVGGGWLEISGPRTPCENQARHIGRPDWVELTLRELRTGIYACVMAAGALKAGDSLILESRPNPDLTILELSRCYFHLSPGPTAGAADRPHAAHAGRSDHG